MINHIKDHANKYRDYKQQIKHNQHYFNEKLTDNFLESIKAITEQLDNKLTLSYDLYNACINAIDNFDLQILVYKNNNFVSEKLDLFKECKAEIHEIAVAPLKKIELTGSIDALQKKNRTRREMD